MNNSDILRRVRHIFDFNDQLMLSIFKLGGYEGSKPELAAWLRPEDESELVLCEDEKLARFLNGLIIKNRGPKGDDIPEPERVLSNNMVLRKLNIALNLQADDLIEMLKPTEFLLSKHELSALFRRPDNKHYRECPDELLSTVLDVMEKRYKKA
jgi:uncharacterized protein YehS (DUF1456 family)